MNKKNTSFLSEDERTLFRRAMDSFAGVPSEAHIEHDAHAHPPIGIKQIRRKLKNGKMIAEDSIDLHGLTVAEAERAVTSFLVHAARKRLRCVCIVTGKGLRSEDGVPVLRNFMTTWLAQQQLVAAVDTAPPAAGGNGALHVVLKTSSLQ